MIWLSKIQLCWVLWGGGLKQPWQKFRTVRHWSTCVLKEFWGLV